MNKRVEKHLSNLEKIRGWIRLLTTYLLYVLAVLIIIGIILQMLALPQSFKSLLETGTGGFTSFLKYVIDMIIGIELVHLLCHPNLDNVVEILLVAITREIVLAEMSPLGLLCGVVCIAILFAVRKFLFVDKLDSHARNMDD